MRFALDSIGYPGHPSLVALSIPDQADPNAGCIPACAIGVLSSTGRPVPTEANLINRMWVQQLSGSGFERLKIALSYEGIAVVVERPTNLAARLTSLCNSGVPVLVALKNRQGAHCVVVEAVVGALATVHDPDPRVSNPQSVDIATLTAAWCEDIAYCP